MVWPREFHTDALDVLHEWQNEEYTDLQALDRLWELVERDISSLCEALNCSETAVCCREHGYR